VQGESTKDASSSRTSCNKKKINSFHGESLKPRFIQLVLSKVNGFGVPQERAVRTIYLLKIPDGGVLNLVTNGI
jgi:hypothetical protein